VQMLGVLIDAKHCQRLRPPGSTNSSSASSNRSKSARDPAEWLPTNVSYRCQYAEDWMAVKVKWELSVDAKEFEALRGVSVECVN